MILYIKEDTCFPLGKRKVWGVRLEVGGDPLQQGICDLKENQEK